MGMIIDKKITKEIVDEIMAIPGEARGGAIKNDWKVLFLKKGKQGILKLEERMKELGVPIIYNKIKIMDFYPIGVDMLSMLVMREIFDFEEKDFKELGKRQVKISSLLKFLIRHFASIKLLIKGANAMWREHYTTGELSIINTNIKDSRITIILKDFETHRFFCALLCGYFAEMLSIVLATDVSCNEMKCPLKGAHYHEFLLKW